MKMSPTSTHPPEAADQFCEDAETDERIPVAREWQQLAELTHAQPAALNAALKKLGSAIRLNDEEIPQVSAIFARCLAVKPPAGRPRVKRSPFVPFLSPDRGTVRKPS